MKQILQHLGSGLTELVECPAPKVRPGHLLIDSRVSLISAGTERMLVEFGRAGLLAKARQQPEKVKMVLDKVKTDGLLTTVDAIRSKLDQPIPLGYCNVGTVREVGAGVDGFKVGDRVASNGSHADVVVVGKNLAARIPDNVSDEAAAFTVLGAIGLQGVRLAQPCLGDSFVVTGAGLIGLLTVQLLIASGARVLAIDFDQAKLDLAAGFGAQTCNVAKGGNAVAAAMAFSGGQGVDGVIVTASTESSDPINEAAEMCRRRGRIVQVGLTGLDLKRRDFYEKELTFHVSCSYGPGRYDPVYEEKGQDYPLAFVRWTEQRNFQAILEMMATGRIDVEPLISHRFAFDDAPKAYDLLAGEGQVLGVLLTYEGAADDRHEASVALKEPGHFRAGTPVVGFIGAGNYAARTLIPAFKAAGANLHSVASAGGSSGVIQGRKSGFQRASSSASDVIADPEINTVAIVTRHDTHARLTNEALRAGKHVFVEKPLALNLDELQQIQDCHAQSDTQLMVGFNRRFSPLTQKMKSLLDNSTEPKAFIMTMNAGHVPADHWVQDPEIGGGRIIGEACHLIDLMRYLAGAPIVEVKAMAMGGAANAALDKASIGLTFEDGSFGTVHYLANGGSSFPKERIEAFSGGGTLQIDNFVKLRGFNWKGFRKMSLMRQDKGQLECARRFLAAVETGANPAIPVEELFETSRAAIEAYNQLRGD